MTSLAHRGASVLAMVLCVLFASAVGRVLEDELCAGASGICVFAAADGEDTSECGPAEAPCRSIGAAVAHCTGNCSVVSVSAGVYAPFVLEAPILVRGSTNASDVIVQCPEAFETVGIFVRVVPAAVQLMTVQGCTRAGVRLDTHVQRRDVGDAWPAAEAVDSSFGALRGDRESGGSEPDTGDGGLIPSERYGDGRVGRSGRDVDAQNIELLLTGMVLRNNSRAVLVATDSIRISGSFFFDNVNTVNGAAIAFISKQGHGQVFVQRCFFSGNGVRGRFPDELLSGVGVILYSGVSDYISVDSCVFLNTVVDMDIDHVSLISTRSERVVLANVIVSDPLTMLGDARGVTVLDVPYANEARIIGMEVAYAGTRVLQVLNCVQCTTVTVSDVHLDALTLGAFYGPAGAAATVVQFDRLAQRVSIQNVVIGKCTLLAPLVALSDTTVVASVVVDSSHLAVPLFAGADGVIRYVTLDNTVGEQALLVDQTYVHGVVSFVWISRSSSLKDELATFSQCALSSLNVTNSSGTVHMNRTPATSLYFADITQVLPVLAISNSSVGFGHFSDIQCEGFAPVVVQSASTILGSVFNRTSSVGMDASAGALWLAPLKEAEDVGTTIIGCVFERTHSDYAGAAIIVNHNVNVNDCRFTNTTARVFPGFNGAIVVDESLLAREVAPLCMYLTNGKWKIETIDVENREPYSAAITSSVFHNVDPAFSAYFVMRPRYGIESPVDFWIQAYGYCGFPHLDADDSDMFTVVPTRVSTNEPKEVVITKEHDGLYRVTMQDPEEGAYFVSALIRDSPMDRPGGAQTTAVGPGTTQTDLYVDGNEGSNAPYCGTMQLPCDSLSLGLSNAFPGDYMHVAPATYTGSVNLELRPPPFIIIAPWHRNASEAPPLFDPARQRARTSHKIRPTNLFSNLLRRQLEKDFADRADRVTPVIDCEDRPTNVIYGSWPFSMANFTLTRCGANAVALSPSAYIYGFDFVNNTVDQTKAGLVAPTAPTHRKQYPRSWRLEQCLFQGNVIAQGSYLVDASTFAFLTENVFNHNSGQLVGSGRTQTLTITYEFLMFINLVQHNTGAPQGLIVADAYVNSFAWNWFSDNEAAAIVIDKTASLSFLVVVDVERTMLSHKVDAVDTPLYLRGDLALIGHVTVTGTRVLTVPTSHDQLISGGAVLNVGLGFVRHCKFVNNSATDAPSAIKVDRPLYPPTRVAKRAPADLDEEALVRIVHSRIDSNLVVTPERNSSIGTLLVAWPLSTVSVQFTTFANNTAFLVPSENPPPWMPITAYPAGVASAPNGVLLFHNCSIHADASSTVQIIAGGSLTMFGTNVTGSPLPAQGKRTVISVLAPVELVGMEDCHFESLNSAVLVGSSIKKGFVVLRDSTFVGVHPSGSAEDYAVIQLDGYSERTVEGGSTLAVAWTIFHGCGHPLMLNDTRIMVNIAQSVFMASDNSIVSGAHTFTVYHSAFVGNHGATGGALSFQQAPFANTKGGSVVATVLGCLFWRNTAAFGGALHTHTLGAGSSVITVSTSWFEGNSATEGSAACIRSGRATFDSSVFANNVATRQAGYSGAILVLAQEAGFSPFDSMLCDYQPFCGRRVAAYNTSSSDDSVSDCCISKCQFRNNTELASYANVSVIYPGDPANDTLCSYEPCFSAGDYPVVQVQALDICHEPLAVGDSSPLFDCSVALDPAIPRDAAMLSCVVRHVNGSMYSLAYSDAPTIYGSYVVDVALLGCDLMDSPLGYSVIPNEIDPSSTTLELEAAEGPIYCDERTFEMFIETRDAFDNPGMRPAEEVTVDMVRLDDGMQYAVNVTYIGAGAYRSCYVATESNATQHLRANVTVNGVLVASVPLTDVPSDVNTTAASFEFEGAGSSGGVEPSTAGVPSSFAVTLSAGGQCLRSCVAERCMGASLVYIGSECENSSSPMPPPSPPEPTPSPTPGRIPRSWLPPSAALHAQESGSAMPNRAAPSKRAPPLSLDTGLSCSDKEDAAAYSFSFAAEKMGCYQAHVTYDGEELSGAGSCLDEQNQIVNCDDRWVVYVHAGEPSFNDSVISCDVCESGVILVSEKYTWTVELRDCFDNSIPCSADKPIRLIECYGEDHCQESSMRFMCTTDANGQSTISGSLISHSRGPMTVTFVVAGGHVTYEMRSACGPGTKILMNSTCEQCPPNTFQPELDGSSCEPCGAHSSTDSVGNSLPEACVCDEGYYPSDDGVCVWCGGLWQEVNEACEGGDVCASAHEGFRCADCDDHHFRFFAYCADCNIAIFGLCFFIILGVFSIVLYLFAAFYHSLEEAIILLRFLQHTALLVFLRAPWPKAIVWVFAFLSFATLSEQLLGLPCWGISPTVTPYLPFLWPIILQPVLLVCTVVMIAWRRYAVNRQWLSEVDNVSVGQSIVLGIMSVTTGSLKSSMEEELDYCSFFWRIYRSLNLLMLMYLYTPLTFASLIPWNCIDTGDGRYVVMEGTLECYDWDGPWFWDHALPSIVAFLCIGIGIPLGIGLLLLHHKQVTEQERESANCEEEMELSFVSSRASHPSHHTASTRTTTPFNLNCLHYPLVWWWPVLVLLESLVVVLILQLVTDHVAQLLSFALLLVEMCGLRFSYRKKVASEHLYLHWIATLVPLAHVLVLGASTPLVLHDPSEPTDELVLPIVILIALSLLLATVIALWLGLDARRRRAGSWKNSRMFDVRPYESAMKLVLEQDAVLRSWEINYSELDIEHPPMARGAYGIVSRAMYNGTLVAVKTLLYGIGEEDRVQEEFHREIQNFSRLHHPNIVLFIGACLDPLCIVIEYVERGSLADVLKREREQLRRESNSSLVPPTSGSIQAPSSGEVRSAEDEDLEIFTEDDCAPISGEVTSADQGQLWVGMSGRLPWARRLAIAIGAARGMAYLHSKGIIHRDLKSPNILITSDWNAKITDFGGSKATSIQSRGLMTKTNIGTTRWLAPEIHRGEEYTQAVDVYSFGIVLWELLAGKIPFADIPWDAEVIDGVKRGMRPPIPPYAPPRMRELIERCWDGNAARRPDFKYILDQLLEMDESA